MYIHLETYSMGERAQHFEARNNTPESQKSTRREFLKLSGEAAIAGLAAKTLFFGGSKVEGAVAQERGRVRQRPDEQETHTAQSREIQQGPERKFRPVHFPAEVRGVSREADGALTAELQTLLQMELFRLRRELKQDLSPCILTVGELVTKESQSRLGTGLANEADRQIAQAPVNVPSLGNGRIAQAAGQALDSMLRWGRRKAEAKTREKLAPVEGRAELSFTMHAGTETQTGRVTLKYEKVEGKVVPKNIVLGSGVELPVHNATQISGQNIAEMKSFVAHELLEAAFSVAGPDAEQFPVATMVRRYVKEASVETGGQSKTVRPKR